MVDVFSKKKRSQVMAAIRSHGNKDTELKLASILRAHGIKGWRRQQKLPGKPDFVFRKQRLAVFVDGCFWHGCRWHCRMPQTHRKYWQRKIARNSARDRATTRLLRATGWRVLRLWGHALRKSDSVAQRIISELRAGRERCRVRATGMNDTSENASAECFAGISLMRIGSERTDWRMASLPRNCNHQ
jgi:DNA mismatch endonuclease, patch repair protein